MQPLQTAMHPDVFPLEGKSMFHRRAARAIVLRGEDILLLYTARYHDYSLPGGGVDDGESETEGMIRELQEETGARNIRNIVPFCTYEEYRPWYKPDYDVMHMLSHCFYCEIDEELGDVAFEEYEVKNGMRPVWINIHEAIAHNKHTLHNSDKKGLSLEREIFLLEKIANALTH
ncbi:NUDIX hydrolase [Enterovibrio nigricans]|uniref:NUDIX domain-containing protein n=1 Tax=Enterovibrio nigricans DSM 22720 TaxID=1121868 RepID=A0A1T4UDU8_9GAMM|nr:NUDIX hydrolase [Enterovibrio nigricans]SKA50859.1 NUDIX domain-containing protein [Enterovibrio nigricans DSM 22720]